MLIYHRTSILESDVQTVVNTVNCVGVMGKGIAAAFKDKFPAMFQGYQEICAQGLLEPGKLWLWKGPEQWVLNFPTKKHWRHPSKLEWIEAGLAKFASEYQRRGITEISFPRLGCGNGGLSWDDVRPLMERYLSPLPIKIFVHDHTVDIGVPEHLERASQLEDTCLVSQVGSFDKFRCQLDAVIEKIGDDLVDLTTHEPFSVISTDAGLLLQSNYRTALVAEEDLRSAWLVLATGLLTQERLGWSSGDDATRLLSLVSFLPGARPIEIQKAMAPEPELAVQLRRNASAPGAAESGRQFEMSWG
ncbi:MAG: macro domain-containing protein [Terricaulis sp.]